MKTKVTAVFDIGRTNKKFFLFDENYQEVYREYTRFDEIVDEDGYPTENLEALKIWAIEVFDRMLISSDFDIEAMNFSCYGASLVHIDENGRVLTPLYNYMKPLKSEIYDSFYDKYGPKDEFSRITGSLKLGMLNTGMQLYWLKYEKPEVFEKIKYSLHLPQYLSYLFTGIPVSEYTSIGCHTMLWDYEKKGYHAWVYQEGINKKLPSITSARKTVPVDYKRKIIKIGVGIHDSSSAILPYVQSITKPFVLVSTGTWSIAINPFSKGMLTLDDIENDCLYNMRIDGSPVKVSRLFLGNEYKIQVKALSDHFDVPKDYHRSVKFDQEIFFEINKDFVPMFKWHSIAAQNMPKETRITYDRFENAYHQLMAELIILQVKCIKKAIGNDDIPNLYVDGGFGENDVFIKLLSHHFRGKKLQTTDASLGSALGAAISISDTKLNSKFLKNNCALQKHIPFIIR